MKTFKKKYFLKLFTLIILLSFLVYSCSQFTLDLPIEGIEEETEQYYQNLPYTEVEFDLVIPKAIQEEIVFEVVDDITGIELNPARYLMEKLDDNHYRIILPVQVPSIIKYRFYRNNNLPIYETDSDNQLIEYRMAYINTPANIANQLINWADEQYTYKFGTVKGQIINSETKSPIPNALIIIGGMHSYTNSLGQFVVNNLPPGKHNLLVMSTDGEYSIFQQEAVVGEGLTTPASIGVQASKFVKITFIVKTPANNPSEASIRMLGNTYQLGNIFGNIYNGTSIAPARAPKLTLLSNGKYSITMNLPSGFDLHYKYSMGDGFWNAELDQNNNFVVRKLVIPDQDTVINDAIYSWTSSGTDGVEFTVKVPEFTPKEDKISIQFDSFGWSPPIQMWKVNDNQWNYRLFGPYHLVSKINYRFCRNDACGIADDGSAPINGYSFDTSSLPTSLNINVTEWKGLYSYNFSYPLATEAVKPRDVDFVTGFSLTNNYNVYTPIYSESAFKIIKETSANTVIIPFKWTLQSINPVSFSPVTGENPLWKDLILMIQKSQSQGLNVWLSPEVEITPNVVKQISQGQLNENWLSEFSTQYLEYLYFAADLAKYMDIEGLVFPTDVIHLANFENYGELSQILVTDLSSNIENIRNRFPKKIYLAINLNQTQDSMIFQFADGFIVSPTIDFTQSIENANYDLIFRTYLEDIVYSQLSSYHKPVYLLINFPSIKGADKGCVMVEDECYSYNIINKVGNGLNVNFFETDMEIQAKLYDAAFHGMNEIDWISGIISNEFNTQVSLMDYSSSVRGKPAFNIILAWYPKILGVDQ